MAARKVAVDFNGKALSPKIQEISSRPKPNEGAAAAARIHTKVSIVKLLIWRFKAKARSRKAGLC